jgi:hypothetical protein
MQRAVCAGAMAVEVRAEEKEVQRTSLTSTTIWPEDTEHRLVICPF